MLTLMPATDDDYAFERRAPDRQLSELLIRLGKIETALDITAERLSALTTRLDREVLRRVELSEHQFEAQDKRIDELEAFRDGAQGALRLVQVLIGTSVLGALLTSLSIYLILTGPHS
jgi:hypothetical protein